MPITNETVQITYKLLPLTLRSDGSASISVRRGLQYGDGNWECIGEETVDMDPTVVSSVLDAPAIDGLSRRDDLSYAVYQHLVSIGKISGNIS